MLLLLGAFLLLMLLGLPVALAMATRRWCISLVTGITPDVTLAQRMIAGVESFPLLAVPFFILAGNLMNIAGVTGPHLQLRGRAGRLDARRSRPRQHHRLGDLLRHVRHGASPMPPASAPSRSRR